MNEITSLSPSVMRQIKLPYATPTCSHRRWLHRGNRELRRLCLQHVCYFMLDVRTSVGRDIRVGIIRDDLGFGLGSGLGVTLIRLLFGVRIRGPIYKISYDLSQDYRKLIVRSTYDSDLQRAQSSLGNIVSLFTNTISDDFTILQVNCIREKPCVLRKMFGKWDV